VGKSDSVFAIVSGMLDGGHIASAPFATLRAGWVIVPGTKFLPSGGLIPAPEPHMESHGTMESVDHTATTDDEG
jgi:hypothetical protein